jgi:non-specific serine/threonine protein kinase/serine/threonine-protein kinase
VSTDRYRRAKEIFVAACELGPAERETCLREACGDDDELRHEVESLLRFHDEEGGVLDSPGSEEPGHGVEADETELLSRSAGAGMHFSDFRLLQKVGEGGMGEVWEADQLRPVRRKVAIKVIKAGMDSKAVVARFESERQALALMDHPNIARVFDAGTTEEGRPFFAMEYIRGEPITRYCDRHRLDTRERLELFAQVCDGVQHAHQKGVIHRDLKPSNVLVRILDDRPVPTIIDFGIAKATQQRLTEQTMFTAMGMLIGTPEYMSPEQAEMTGLDVDTRTDVYSLGVMLYELLAGALPFDSRTLREAGFDEIRRRIREEEPSKPSMKVTTLGESTTGTAERRRTDPGSLRRQLKGDLDWITMKALEKDRTRRYGSPAELAADIERHLCHEPVVAGPPGFGYRAGKFVRRHRAGVAAAALVLAVLVVGIVGTTYGFLRARREAETARRVSDVMIQLFNDLNPFAVAGKAGDPGEILDRAAGRIEGELDDAPLVQARMIGALARAYHGVGRLDEAHRFAEKSAARHLELLGDGHPDYATSISHFGDLLWQEGEYEQSRRLHEQALAIWREVHGPDHPRVAATLNSLGLVHWRKSELEAAREKHRQALAIEERAHGRDSYAASRTLFLLALVELDLMEHESAQRNLQRALQIRERTWGEDHLTVAEVLTELGRSYVETGAPEQGLPHLRRAVRIVESAVGPEHFQMAFPLQNMARALSALREDEAAMAAYERALRLQERDLGPDHQDIAYTLRGIGALLLRRGDVSDARQAFERALATFETTFGPDHLAVARMLHALAYLEYSVGDYDRARAHDERAMEIRRTVFGPGHRGLTPSLYALACLAALDGDRERALALLGEALDCGYASSFILSDPDFDSLRGDPEFEAMLDEVRSRLAEHSP